MNYLIILSALLAILLACNIIMLYYLVKLKQKAAVKEAEVKDKEVFIDYANYGIEMYKNKIHDLEVENKKIKSENRMLVDKINKMNSQFKNVKDYLSKD